MACWLLALSPKKSSVKVPYSLPFYPSRQCKLHNFYTICKYIGYTCNLILIKLSVKSPWPHILSGYWNSYSETDRYRGQVGAHYLKATKFLLSNDGKIFVIKNWLVCLKCWHNFPCWKFHTTKFLWRFSKIYSCSHAPLNFSIFSIFLISEIHTSLNHPELNEIPSCFCYSYEN